MDTPRREVTPPGRYLVAMRPEASTADAQGTARVLGLAPEVVRDVFGGGWPRIIASRSSWGEAESLVRVLTARGREAIAWDREMPLVELFHAESLLVEGGQLVLEQRGRAHRLYPLDKVQRVVDLRLRPGKTTGAEDGWLRSRSAAPPGREEFPDRALLVVPSPGWSQPGVLSTRSVVVEAVARPHLLAAQFVQQAALQVRAWAPDKLTEMRAHPSVLGVDEAEREPLERMLQLLARLPPTPAPSSAPAAP